ncbi:MAG: hypothetical protein IT182_07260 [Acidobacteria bacterium]|nr:hypothetical protein [Acidobacteriota bacterium]
MVLQPATSLSTRVVGGRGLWALVAFLFPTLAVVKDQSVVLAMLLFLMETLLASALLGVRLAASRRAMSGDHTALRRLHEVGKALGIFVLPFSLGCVVLLGVVTFIEVANGRASHDVAAFADRAGWMAGMLLATAVLDSLVAPVRTVTWLESAVSWQSSRTAVMFLAVMVGWPVMLWTGTTQGLFWGFFGLRLLSDLGSLAPGERERIRATMFGDAL